MNPSISESSAEPSGSADRRKRARAPRSPRTPGGLEQRLLRRARAAGFSRGDLLVVGFSGGRDSLALAAALRRVRDTLGLGLLLIHVDHGLRASAADEAARAVTLAQALGLELRVARLSAPPAETHPGVGLEEAARRERYRILFDIAAETGARAVAAAHHEQDQAETVLLHLLRGGGLPGAAGMSETSPPPLAPHDISRENLESQPHPWLWRPLLAEPRAVIAAYVARLGLEPIADPSNADVKFRRNAVRHEILPLLERWFPGASAALARYATLAAEDDRALHDLAAAILSGAMRPDGALSADALRPQPLALRRRIVREWLWRITGLSSFSAERTEAVLHLVAGGRGGRAIEIGEGWTVRAERGMLHARRGAGDTGSRGEGNGS